MRNFKMIIRTVCIFVIMTMMCHLLVVNVSAENVISSDSIERAIAYAYNIKDTNPSRFSGYCAAFVWRCYHDGAGLGNSSYATAREMGDALITNTDSNPPRGAFVFWYDSNGPSTKAGHVALSLGDGNVIHAYSDVKITSIATVNSSHYIYRGWGAPIAGYRLATEEPLDPPTNCWISIDKGPESTYNVSETVKLTYHAESVKYYTVEIYKDGASFECFDTYYGEYSKTMTAVGRYNAVVSAVNSGGRTYSGWISWNVVDPSAVGPAVPYVAVSNREVFPNEQFRINFWAETAKYYNVKITKDGVTYKDETVYVGYYDTSLSNTGQYSIQITAVNDYGASEGYDGVFIIDSVPRMPTITTSYDCYGINEDIDIILNCGKYTQTSYMTIRRLSTEWETVFSGDVTNITKKTMSFPTTGYYTIEYQNANIYGASPCASKGLYVYDSVPEMPEVSLSKYVYNTSEDIDISLNQGVNARTSYISIYNSSSQLVFSEDVSGIKSKTVVFDETGTYTINYQSANSVGQSKIALISFEVVKDEIIVNFNPNGGHIVITEQLVYKDMPYGTLPTPTREGYIFKGWFTSAEGGTQITSDTTVTTNSEQTLYAHWESISPHTETQVVKNGNSYNISVTSFNLENAQIIVTGYKDDEVIYMEILDSNDIKPITFTGDFDTFKVMAWEDILTLKSVCKAETIPQSKWITE